MSTAIRSVARCLEKFAPAALAESWDNVGILVEAPEKGRTQMTYVVMLCIDYTTRVLEECISKKVDVLIAYHPPIFRPMKKLVLTDHKQSLILQAIQHGISIYSPHTSLDSCPGGVNDWLASLLYRGDTRPITPTELSLPGFEKAGLGRLINLTDDISLQQLLTRIKAGLGIDQVRLAMSHSHTMSSTVKSVAICAGSGSSVLNGVAADVFLTGEMGHHDLLAANSRGSSVILCEHSNTERGYLRDVLAKNLKLELTEMKILVSEVDADPVCFA